MSAVINTIKNFLSPSPRAKVQKSRRRGQQDIVTMFSHQRALAASRQTLTPPSLTTASSSEDRSSEPKDRSMTPGKQSTPASTLNDSLHTNDDVKTKLFQPDQDGNNNANRRNVSGDTLVEASDQAGQELLTASMDGLDPLWGMGLMVGNNLPAASTEQAQDTTQTSKAMKIADQAEQELLTTGMDGLDPLWGMGQMVGNNSSAASTEQAQNTTQTSKAMKTADQNDQELPATGMDGLDPLWDMGQMVGDNPPAASTEQAPDTTQTSKAMKIFGSAAHKVQKPIAKQKHQQAQPEGSKTAASSRPQRATPKRPNLHSSTQDSPSFDTPSIEEPASKRLRPSMMGKQKEASPQNLAPISKPVRKPTKPWLNHGLFLGQDISDNKPKSKKTSASPEPEKKVNSILPRPMFAKRKLLEDPHAQLDFKLPFDVFSPLPSGQPKPDDWKKLTRNQFSDDAATVWKKLKHVEHSTCSCDPQTGCDENCMNRHMMYECDDDNCNVGRANCHNRPFADLKDRIKADCLKSGHAYNVGVETVKTADRGFGIRANRSFEPNQIITEYNGEIITRDEGRIRMHTIYKDQKCHYLMDFEQNMMLDATKGSIARFVNHSCAPNCRMEKLTVNNVPRVALFAGENGIMTGEELTYDYKFEPFSKENVQECFCGAEHCRGYLGKQPKEAKEPKEPKEPKAALKPLTKRKVGDFLEGAVDGFKEAIGVRKKQKLTPKISKPEVTVAESSKPKKLTKKPKPAKEKPLPKGWIYPDQPADFTKKVFEADPEAVLRANKRKRKAEEQGANVVQPAPKRPKPS